MKTKILAISLALLLMTFAGNLFASPILIGTSDDLPEGTFQAQQDNVNNVQMLIEKYIKAEVDNLTLLEKIDTPATSGELFSIVMNTNGREHDREEHSSSTGTWIALTPDTPVNYVSVKAGSTKSGAGFALYAYTPASLNGDWGTWELGNKSLSHISFWSTAGETAAVPEPATSMLLAAGLAGLAASYRKKRVVTVTVS